MIKSLRKTFVVSSLSCSRDNNFFQMCQTEVWKKTADAVSPDTKFRTTGTLGEKMEAMNSDSFVAQNTVEKSVFGRGGLFHRHRSASSTLLSTTPLFTKQRGIQLLVVLLIAFLLAFSCLYKFHSGFRRTCQFWKAVAPLVAEFKLTKWKARYIDRLDESEYEKRLDAFHRQAAPKAVEVVRQLGGIYIKMGQFISTLGAGILKDDYVRAMRPVLNGITPRSIDEITTIFEESTGRKLQDVFESFDEIPVGAASIAQAHRATLRNSQQEEVIVKVQYPDISEMLLADLNNMELFMKLVISGDTDDLIHAIRDRHERELDFRLEADNLRECSANMQRHAVEPQIVRIPQVRNETGLCTEHILIMEYLKGISLSDAIHEEQDRMARALGHRDGEDLRSALSKKMKEHFENGQEKTRDRGGGKTSSGNGGGDGMLGTLFEGNGSSGMMKLVRTLIAGGPFMGLVRAYANLRAGVDDFGQSTCVFFLGNRRRCNKSILGDEKSGRTKDALIKHPRVNIGRALKALIHVHGLQVIKDGVYNADPHPGNVLILPDGRLGLLDYGMVVRIDPEDRKKVAKTILALARGDKNETAHMYASTGYRADWASGSGITDVNAIHRIATIHLDKFDLSSLRIMDENSQEYKKVAAMEMLRDVREKSIPPWIENVRRLGSLLLGVSAQAARPISLSKEWESIAEESLGGCQKRFKKKEVCRKQKQKQKQK